MSAGTITLTNNSATVTGSGTAFTDMAPGDFIVATVGGITYTMPVSAVDSAAQVTLIAKYTGPTQSGLAWGAVPRSTQNQVTAELVAQATQALRGLNYDKANWQQVFSTSGNITVRLPDGSTFTGPSWSSISTAINGKANSSDVLTKSDNLASVSDKFTARTNLGLGDSATRNVGALANTVASGDDVRFSNFVVTTNPRNVTLGNSYRLDVPSGLICHGGANSASRASVFTVDWTASGGPHLFIDSTDLGQFQFVTSDQRLKTDVRPATQGFLERVNSQEVIEYEWIDKKMRGDRRMRGFIAQKVGGVDSMLMTGTEEGQLGLDIIGMLADAYGAIQELSKQEARNKNIEAFLQTMGFDPQKDYTATEETQGS